MSSHLLVVESPAKAKTLGKYLGNNFKILASYGHVRDLVPKNGAVDVDNDFAMKYQNIASHTKYINAIVNAARNAQCVYLATDPDREGEAIAWHITQILRSKKILQDKTIKRLAFHEITKDAVQEAIANPRNILQELVDAQQARRALDYLVGFNLSPLLWKKIRRGLSAGRVQSPALRLICEREQMIRDFVTQEYWTVHLSSHKGSQKLFAKLMAVNGKKIAQFDIPNEAIKSALIEQFAEKMARVIKIQNKKKTRNPAPPFTTSTLQQEASHKLGMTTDKTMRVAQQLYEGVNIGQETVGLISYMRTDSVTLAKEALLDLRRYIQVNYPANCLPAKPILFKNKTKNAQEAHEAIRPTSIDRAPDKLKPYLTQDQYRLYDIIWKRTISCQMSPAIFEATTVDLKLGEGIFRATGQVLIFPSFLSIYQYAEGISDEEDRDNVDLPALKEGELLTVDAIYGEQHFTQPLARFNEASLVKALEEYGIGRPSTYVSIISTLKHRKYVAFEKKRFTPTDTGEVVNKFLTEHFAQYVDYNFTAHMEDQLDDIATGNGHWITLLHGFWRDFSGQISAKASLTRMEVTTESLDEVCPKCSKPMLLRFGKLGRFAGCSGYPDCRYTHNINGISAQQITEENSMLEGRTCPVCQGDLLIKNGSYSKFIGCTNYPQCKYSEPLEKPQDTGIACPLCQQGRLITKKSRYGKLFYGCSMYPSCQYALWDKPLNESCPTCGWSILIQKTTKRSGHSKRCPQKNCVYSVPIHTPDE
ncbi:MAG: type I DNA topoisomerase [Neisseriales bacterium]|nr:MAG: type I DNA topoisomerase [Neisseriales bacterium]